MHWLFPENPLIVPPKGKPSWYKDLTCKNIKARLKRAKRYRKMDTGNSRKPEEGIWYMMLDAVEIYWECQFRDNKRGRKIFWSNNNRLALVSIQTDTSTTALSNFLLSSRKASPSPLFSGFAYGSSWLDCPELQFCFSQINSFWW